MEQERHRKWLGIAKFVFSADITRNTENDYFYGRFAPMRDVALRAGCKMRDAG
jgi:hypothetical protein